MVIYNDSLKSWLIIKRREPKQSAERIELLCSYPSARDSERELDADEASQGICWTSY